MIEFRYDTQLLIDGENLNKEDIVEYFVIKPRHEFLKNLKTMNKVNGFELFVNL